MSLFNEINTEADKDLIVETVEVTTSLLISINESTPDDAIVGGMGRTGILKEFHRLEEAEDKLRVFALYHVNDNGRRESNALPRAIISVPATKNRDDDVKAAREIGKEINRDYGTGFYEYEDTSADSFSEELSDAKDRLNLIKHIVELVNHRSSNAGVKTIR